MLWKGLNTGMGCLLALEGAKLWLGSATGNPRVSQAIPVPVSEHVKNAQAGMFDVLERMGKVRDVANTSKTPRRACFMCSRKWANT